MITNVRIVDNSDKVRDALDDAIGKALWSIGATAEGYAKKLCPVKTGRLRNSITHAERNYSGVATYKDNDGNVYGGGSAKGKPEDNAVYIGTNVEYGAAVEYGGGKRIPKPFLKPAATQHSDEYKAIVEAALESAE